MLKQAQEKLRRNAAKAHSDTWARCPLSPYQRLMTSALNPKKRSGSREKTVRSVDFAVVAVEQHSRRHRPSPFFTEGLPNQPAERATKQARKKITKQRCIRPAFFSNGNSEREKISNSESQHVWSSCSFPEADARRRPFARAVTLFATSARSMWRTWEEFAPVTMVTTSIVQAGLGCKLMQSGCVCRKVCRDAGGRCCRREQQQQQP